MTDHCAIWTLIFINMHLLDIRDRLTSSEYVHRQKWKWLRIQLVLLFAHLTECNNNYQLKSLMYQKPRIKDTDIQTLLTNSGSKIANRLESIETAIDILLKKYNISTGS